MTIKDIFLRNPSVIGVHIRAVRGDTAPKYSAELVTPGDDGDEYYWSGWFPSIEEAVESGYQELVEEQTNRVYKPT